MAAATFAQRCDALLRYEVAVEVRRKRAVATALWRDALRQRVLSQL
jgi:hypothetical protein